MIEEVFVLFSYGFVTGHKVIILSEMGN